MKGIQVVRNGVECTISAGVRLCTNLYDSHLTLIGLQEVVVGDIVLLAPGEIIPCDGIFLSGHNVTCDESAPRGETVVVHKAPFFECVTLKQAHLQRVVDVNNYGSAPTDTCGHGTDCFIVSGSKVLEGVGRYVVVAVGTRSRVMVAHRASTRVLSDKSFKRFFTRLCRIPHSEVVPIVGPDTEWTSSIGLDYDSIAAPTYLHGCRNIPMFVFLSCHWSRLGTDPRISDHLWRCMYPTWVLYRVTNWDPPHCFEWRRVKIILRITIPSLSMCVPPKRRQCGDLILA